MRPRKSGALRLFVSILGLCMVTSVIGCTDAGSSKPGAEAPPPTQTPPPLSRSTNVIHVLPFDGIGGPLRLVLSDAVAASLRDSERPAVLAEKANDQGPSIIAKVAKVRTRGSIVWITTNWALRAPYGTIVAERSREIVVDKEFWDRNSVEVVNLIVGDAMPAVAAMVQDHVGPLHVAQEVVEEPRVTELSAASPASPRLAPPPEAAMPALPEEPAAMPDLTAEAPPEAATELMEAPSAAAAPETMASPAPEPAAAPVPAAAPEAATRPPLVLAPKSAAPGSAPPDVEGLTPDEISAVPADVGPLADSPIADDPVAAPDVPAAAAPPPAAEPAATAAQPAPPTAAGMASSPGDTPVVWGRPSFLLRPVRGAPGDGNQALAAALRAALRTKDLTVTDDPRQAGYEVVGTVDVGPPVNGRQRARIAWVVNTISGEEVGKAVQENVIAAGSLNRNWGRVADVVTAAAADGIQQLFEAPRPKYTPVGAVPQFPKIPPLPRVPGRALPPPPS